MNAVYVVGQEDADIARPDHDFISNREVGEIWAAAVIMPLPVDIDLGSLDANHNAPGLVVMRGDPASGQPADRFNHQCFIILFVQNGNAEALIWITVTQGWIMPVGFGRQAPRKRRNLLDDRFRVRDLPGNRFEVRYEGIERISGHPNHRMKVPKTTQSGEWQVWIFCARCSLPSRRLGDMSSRCDDVAATGWESAIFSRYRRDHRARCMGGCTMPYEQPAKRGTRPDARGQGPCSGTDWTFRVAAGRTQQMRIVGGVAIIAPSLQLG